MTTKQEEKACRVTQEGYHHQRTVQRNGTVKL